MKRISTFLIPALSIIFAEAAWAKTARLEWEEIEGAHGYEVELGKPKGPSEKIQTASAKVKKDLPPGVYQYRLRAIDRFKRAGEWSEWLPLVLMPEDTVEPVFPGKGERVRSFTGTPQAELKWKPLLGVTRYRVSVFQRGKAIKETVVDGTSVKIDDLPLGDLQWQVRGVLVGTQKTWDTPPSSLRAMVLERKELLAPDLKYPVGGVSPRRRAQSLTMKWSEVEGASLYEVKVWAPARAARGKRIPASENEPSLKVYRSEKNSMVVPMPAKGEYRWQVRAIASQGANRMEHTGAISVEDFQLSPHAGYQEGSGWMAASAMFAPYQYRYVSGMDNGTARASAMSMIGRLSGEYWFLRFMGVGAAADFNVFRVGGQTHLAKTGELQVKFRMKFGNDKWGGWVFQPRVGVEIRDYFAISPDHTSGLTALGGQVGFDFRKQLGQKFSLGLRATYFLPLTLTGKPDDTDEIWLNGYANHRNASFGLIGAYWPLPRLGIGLGAYLEMKAISVQLPEHVLGSFESVFMDGLYFYSTVIYRFGG